MNPFDKSSSKMIINIIVEKIDNKIIQNIIKHYIQDGDFKKAAEIIGDVIWEGEERRKKLVQITNTLNEIL